MIKYNANFQIEDASIQLGEAYVRVTAFTNKVNKSTANIAITDFTGDIIVKEYVKTFDKLFNDEEEIYLEMLPKFEGGEIV